VPVNKQTTTGLTINEILHLSEDVAIAATCAQTLRKVRRDDTTRTALLHHVLNEIDTLVTKGKNYVPFTETKLDHPVALARELLARHNIDQIYDWIEGNTSEASNHYNGCILHSIPIASAIGNTELDQRLDNSLLVFVRQSLETIQEDRKHKKQALSAIKALLEEREMNSTFEYALNAPLDKLILHDQDLLRSEKSKRLKKPTKPTAALTGLKETAPPVPTKTQAIIKQHMFNCISRELNKSDSPALRLTEPLRSPDTLTLICQKIIQYNPRWNTPPFSVTLAQLDQVLDLANLKPKTMDKLHLIHCTNSVITDLRNSQDKTSPSSTAD